MSISGISAGYYPTGYANNKTTSVATGASFTNIVEQKSMEADIVNMVLECVEVHDGGLLHFYFLDGTELEIETEE